MADNVEQTSLVSLATMKSTTSRDGVDVRARRAAGKSTQGRGFDGFMKSFLGKGNASKSSGWRKGSSSTDSFGSNWRKSGMDEDEKKSLRRSMEKTVPSEESEGEVEVDSDVAAAAEEAAQMIWDLMYGQGGESFEEESGMDGLQQLFNGGGYGGGLSGLGAGGMDMASIRNGIETANASAEMNNAAVLAELDDLLDGMPRDALEAALMRLAEAQEGGEGDLFNRIAAELDAQVVNVGGGEAGMLAWLKGNSVNYGQENSSGMVSEMPAETSGDGTAGSANSMLFSEFLQEEAENGPINNLDSIDAETAEELLQRFGKWLESNGKSLDSKGLSGDVNGFVKMLAIAAGMSAGSAGSAEAGSGQIFSWAKNNLETLLQNNTNGGGNLTNLFASSESFKSLLQNITGEGEGGLDSLSGDTLGANHGHQGAQQAEAAKVNSASNASQVPMSNMMDQIENIERLAEAMRMSNKNGVKHLTMQLTPAEMGKVMLRVEARDGVVSAFLRVEKPEAAAQLANNLAQLRENLKAQGIELGELDIQERGQNEALGDFSGQRQHRDPEAGSARRGTGRVAGLENNGDADAQAETADATGGGPGGLNLFA